MNMAHFYNVTLSWQGDRKGILSSSELNTTLEVATPPPFPKGVENIWSPEHLLTAAVSSCFMTTFLAVAENSKLEFESFACKASGKLEQVEGKYLMTQILLEPQVVLLNEEDKGKAERVLQKSEAACLITNSIKSTVIVTPEILVARLA